MISYGIELEGIYNRPEVNLPDTQSYHHGVMDEEDYWKAENDGSLSIEEADYRAFGRDNTQAIELISKRLVGKEELMKALRMVKEEFCGNKPLKDCIRFNKSCGTHVHFSIRGKTKKRTHIRLLEEMRQEFFDKIESNTIIKKSVKKKILGHYTRSYATLLTKEEYLMPERRSEFNFVSEEKGKGLEWRSINLCGVNKWVELFEVMEIVYHIIKKFDQKVRKYAISEHIKVEQKQLEKLRTLLKPQRNRKLKVKI